MILRAAAVALLLASSTARADADDDAARQALLAGLHGKIASCWAVPPDLPDTVKPVRVKFSLTRSGELDGSPSIDGPVAGDPATKAFAASAVRAVVRCAPYAELAKRASYDAWKTIVVTFNAPDL
ncbi:UNVERIFIED_ORG: hypothetical protein J2W19_003821 [Shinella zoogloeoides]|nr:hypothetical protein [Shinella zoogloeoides]